MIKVFFILPIKHIYSSSQTFMVSVICLFDRQQLIFTHFLYALTFQNSFNYVFTSYFLQKTQKSLHQGHISHVSSSLSSISLNMFSFVLLSSLSFIFLIMSRICHCKYNNKMISNKYDQPKIGMTGCYAIQEDDPPIQLPLKTFSFDIQIVDCFTQVRMTQLYYNPLNKALDVQYVFPVHPASTVTSLEVEFGGKKSQGVVMEKQDAKNKYDEQMNEGAGVAYSEYNSNARDIMKMVVGNIAAKQTVKVVLTYAHTNQLVCNTFYQFKLASTMTPRYARTLQYPNIRFDSFPGSKNIEGGCNWSVNVAIRSSQRIIKVESVTHKLQVNKKDNSNINVTFASSGELPNKDFTLYYTLENFQKPLYSISQSDNSTNAAISFIPKYCDLSIDDAYKQLLTGKPLEVDLDVNKGEYIFLLDRSGSMGGIRIDNAKRALEIFLRSLPEDSYFNVLSFGSNYKYMFDKSAKNTKAAIDEAVKKISEMDADMGGTQILQAITDIVRKEVIPGYPRQLFFLTDGAVSNVSQVLRYIAKHTHYTRINSIGIGSGCSEQLIKGSAERGKGYSIFIEDEEKPEQKIITLLENTLSPVISKIQLEYDRTKVESIVPNPEKMPYLLKNDIANVFINFNGKLTQPFDIVIKYADSKGTNYREKLTINPKSQQNVCPWLNHFINFQKIQALLDAYEYNEDQQDRIFYVKKIDKNSLKAQIIDLSVKHQILTQLTAFLCIDSYAVDQIKKQSINNPKEKINIKGMNPYDHIVSFVNEAEDDGDGGYIDECCVMNFQLPSEDLGKIAKFSQLPKVHREMKMLGKKAGQKDYFKIDGVVKKPNPQRRLPYGFITKQQDVNGAWTEDFLQSLFDDAKELKKAFAAITDNASFITFLVCQYLLRYHSSQAQFGMIIKKGKHYVNKNSSRNWKELQDVFHRYYKPMSK